MFNFLLQLQVDPNSRISASDALIHTWFERSTNLSSDNQEITLKTLQAFNARRRLKSVALALIARKRLVCCKLIGLW